jgi:hypothetical protein
MTPEQKSKFKHLRAHGKSMNQASKGAKITLCQGHWIEGRKWCDECKDYVQDTDCVHWDYES